MAELKPPPRFPGAAKPFRPEKGFPSWPDLIAASKGRWETDVKSASGPRVLIGSNTGMHGAVTNLDGVLAAGLTKAGAQVGRVFCDGSMPACLMATYSEAIPPDMIAEFGLVNRLCKACFNRGTNNHRPMGLPEFRYSDYLKKEDFSDAQSLAASVDLSTLSNWTLDGIAVGEHAQAGALRYYATGDLAGQPRADEVQRRYLEGAILTKRVYERIIAEWKPDVVVLHHGIYSPQGIAADVCRKAGVRVVTWVVAYRKNCFIFSHDDTYHHTMMSEPVETWQELELSERARDEVRAYLESRASGGKDWIYFHEEPDSDFKSFAEKKGIDLSKPVVSMLTNVMWDAQLHYPANAFPGMKDWIIDSIRYFIDRPDLEVVIRVHPAEVRGAIPSRQRVMDEVKKAFPDLPRHIHIIAPDEDASTYALAHASNAVIIYGTKMGTELTPLGKPVIVAGEAWIRNKGVTQDARDKPHYFELLDQLPAAPGQWAPDRERALRYAYHFFFRRMIPLPFLQPNGTGAMFDVDLPSVHDLAPGKWPGLDTITDGILTGAPFVFEAEHAPAAAISLER